MTGPIGRVKLINAIGATMPDQAAVVAARMRIGTMYSGLDANGYVGVLVDEDAVVTAFAVGAPPAVGQPVVCIQDKGAWVAFGGGGSVTSPPWDGGTASLPSHFLSTLEVDGALQLHNDLILGDYTDTGDVIRIRGLYAPDQYEARIYLMTGGAIALALIKGGVEVNRFRVNSDGSLAVGPSGGRIAALPFAEWVGTASLPAIAAGGFSTIQVNFPAGRFTQPPICVVTANNSNVLATCGGATTAKVDVVGREYQAGTSGGTVVYVMATQMTPTASSA
jgi:hypothetical protein